jgi:uncharacterized protein YecT (DUF1311 family)
MLIALVAVVALQDAGQAPSAAAAPNQPFRCIRDGNTSEMNVCLAEDLAREEARMHRYLTAAEQRARAADERPRAFGGPSAQRGYLAASQAAWTAYAGIVCEGVDDSWKDGSIHTAMYLGCMIEMTHERTRVIWRDHLTYMDSTPPVLPEPVTPDGSPSGGRR